MYLAYGWPQSIPLGLGDSDRVVLLRVLGRLLLVVYPASLHLWSASHHKVRLAAAPLLFPSSEGRHQGTILILQALLPVLWFRQIVEHLGGAKRLLV